MKTKLFKLGISLLFFTNLALAQKADYEKYIIKHGNWKETKDTKWEILLTTSKGSLLYYGAIHEDDPKHKQFAEIKKRFEEFKPTVVFYEGPNRGTAENDTLTIQKFGETGYVRFLAKQANIKIVGLEPSSSTLYKYLCDKYPQETVDVYALTKEASRLRARKDLNKEQIIAELNKMFPIASKIFGETKIKTIEQLDIAFKKHYGNEFEWWQAPQSWFDPNAKADRITNKLSTLSSDYRDVYMVGILSQYVNNGEKVFAVVGRNHVPLQEPALKYAVGLK